MSGLILLSVVKPRLENSDTSSMLSVNRFSPDWLVPTARQFLPKDGDETLQPLMLSPRLPAAKTSKCSGFWADSFRPSCMNPIRFVRVV